MFADSGVDVCGLSGLCEDSGVAVCGRSYFEESGVEVLGRSGVSGEKCMVWRDRAVSGEKEFRPPEVAGLEGVDGADFIESMPIADDGRGPVEGRSFRRTVRWRMLKTS